MWRRRHTRVATIKVSCFGSFAEISRLWEGMTSSSRGPRRRDVCSWCITEKSVLVGRGRPDVMSRF